MNPHNEFKDSGAGTSFHKVKLKRQWNRHTWSVIGYITDQESRVLAVLDEPISYILMVEFAKKVAMEFNADFEEMG